jgi:hypothetical protein
MKYFYFVLLAFLFSLTGCKNEGTSPQELPPGYQRDIPWPSLADSPWPMNRGNPQCTGRSKFNGPKFGVVVWEFDSIYTQGSFAIGKDSTIYIMARNGLYSIRPDGKLKWFFESSFSENLTNPIVLSDGTIYAVNSSGIIFALGSDGNKRWEYKTPDYGTYLGGIVMEGMNIGIDGTLYFLDGSKTLCALSLQGKVLWQITDPDFYLGPNTLTFSPDGSTLYIQCISSSICAFDLKSKNIKWKFGNTIISEPPLVDSDGNIYFHTISNTYNDGKPAFYSLKPDGSIRWSFVHNKNDLIGAGADPTIDIYGNTYFASDSLWCLDYNGSLKWKTKLDFYTIIPLVTDKDGVIYISVQTNEGIKIFAYNNVGNILWQTLLNTFIAGESPALGYSFFYYPTYRENKIFALK